MVRYLVILFSLFCAIVLNANAAGIQPGATPSAGYGLNAASTGAPASVVATDITKYYAVVCGYGSNNVTSAYYYKCAKQGGAAADWSVASTKVAYCPGFYVTSNASSAAFSFGYGTAAVAGNSNTAPTGNQDYEQGSSWLSINPTSAGRADYVAIPLRFDATVPAATIYPHILSHTASAFLTVMLICTDQ